MTPLRTSAFKFAALLGCLITLPALAQSDEIKAGDDPSKVGNTVTNSLGMTLAYIPAGEFLMGSPASEAGRRSAEGQYGVHLSKPFLMSTTEVTKGQFAEFVGLTEYLTEAERDRRGLGFDGSDIKRSPDYSWRHTGFNQGDDHPVVNVSWNDAVAFCAWLSEKEGKRYRLPTEAEWEHACRAGTQTARFWGDEPSGGQRHANVGDQSMNRQFPGFLTAPSYDDGAVFPSPVGSYQPNAWGLYDTIGNVREWCSDLYGLYPKGTVTDPSGNTMGNKHVLRGGSWNNAPRDCRSASRRSAEPDYRMINTGFRVVLELD